MKTFSGGRYAVARVTGVEQIPAAWLELVQWAETSPYERADHQWLEEHLRAGTDVPPEAFVLDLYLPIR
jgi:DNA gyrase inhibitor GyrI